VNAWLLEPTYWNWMLLGVVLMAIEAISPGFFFLWMGVAALLVGLVLTVLPGMDWAWQIMLFAVLSVGSIVAWRLRLRQHPTQTADPLLNRRGHQYVGRVFTLDAPVINVATAKSGWMTAPGKWWWIRIARREPGCGSSGWTG